MCECKKLGPFLQKHVYVNFIFYRLSDIVWLSKSFVHDDCLQLYWRTRDMPPLSVLVGIMITAQVTQQHRDNIRLTLTNSKCSCDIKALFFAGSSGDFAQENSAHKDIVQLSFSETMNGGKTYRWFAFANALQTSGVHEFEAVFKMDADTSVDWCGLCNVVAESKNGGPHYYIGRLNDHDNCGEMPLCPPINCSGFSQGCWVYMSGGMYGMSSLSLKKIMRHRYPRDHAVGHEDIQVGLWFKHALPSVALVNIDNGIIWCHNGAFHKQYPTQNIRHHWLQCVK